MHSKAKQLEKGVGNEKGSNGNGISSSLRQCSIR